MKFVITAPPYGARWGKELSGQFARTIKSKTYILFITGKSRAFFKAAEKSEAVKSDIYKKDTYIKERARVLCGLVKRLSLEIQRGEAPSLRITPAPVCALVDAPKALRSKYFFQAHVLGKIDGARKAKTGPARAHTGAGDYDYIFVLLGRGGCPAEDRGIFHGEKKHGKKWGQMDDPDNDQRQRD